MAKPEIYVSMDIEADGPIPGDYSMLSLGAAAFKLGNREPVSTFKVNIEPLPEAGQDPDTMKWWKGQPEAWKRATEFAKEARDAMRCFKEWLEGLPGKPVFVGYPATYDFMFVYHYYVYFVGFPAPFGFQGLDLKTLAMEKMGTSFRGTSKRKMPKHWFEGCPKHTHDALDDAIGQGVLFINMMQDT